MIFIVIFLLNCDWFSSNYGCESRHINYSKCNQNVCKFMLDVGMAANSTQERFGRSKLTGCYDFYVFPMYLW